MLFVGVLKQKESANTAEIAPRRAQWEHGHGVQILGEYWLQTNDPALPAVITIFEADDVSGSLAFFATWDDAFDITIVPAVSAEESLQLAQQMMDQQQQG